MDAQHFEGGLLTTLLNNNEAIIEVELSPEDFQSDSNAEIYSAIDEIIRGKGIADIYTVPDHLQQKTGRDWFHSIATMMHNSQITSTPGLYAQKIREQGVRRKAQEIAYRLTESLSKNKLDGIDSAMLELSKLNRGQGAKVHTVNDMLKAAMSDIEKAYEANYLGQTVTGIPTGLGKLDQVLGGFHPQDLAIVGARPGAGKTAVMLNMAIEAAKPKSITAKVDSKNGAITVIHNAPIVAGITHLQITKTTDGDLFLSDGRTAVNDGDFVEVQENKLSLVGHCGVRAKPSKDGKTTVNQIDGDSVLIFSAEQGISQMGQRCIAIEGG
jgi:replicative DNA helicase